MDSLTVEQIFAKIHTEKNENLSYNLQQTRKEKDTTFKRLRIIESSSNVDALLYYIHPNKNIQMNDKRPHITFAIVCTHQNLLSQISQPYTYTYICFTKKKSTYKDIFGPTCLLGYLI